MTPNQLAYQFFKQHEHEPDVIKRMRKKFWYAVKTGKVHRKPCAACGEKAEAHHPNIVRALYSVLWLCRKHHRDAHSVKGGWGV